MSSQGERPHAAGAAEPDAGVGMPAVLPPAGTAAGAGRGGTDPSPDDSAEAARVEARRELAVVKRMREEAERSRSALAAARREVEAERARLEDLRLRLERERAELTAAGGGLAAERRRPEGGGEAPEPDAPAARPPADEARRPPARARRPAVARASDRRDDLPLLVATAALAVPMLVALLVVLDAL